MGRRRQCYVCKNTFNHFTKYNNGYRGMPEFMKHLDMVGSDIDNFGCLYCGSHDRERHLFMFFDKMKLWDDIKKARILHFAPENNLSLRILALDPSEYIMADLEPQDKNVKRIDITKIPYNDSVFDLIICCHVLEHVPDYLCALREIYRVLRPNGIAILQTPYSTFLKHTFEDENINTDELRSYFYGQADHCRVFSEYDYFSALRQTGFVLQIVKNSDYFDNNVSFYYGINKREDLVKVLKPGSY